jgi:hypothetical protein
LIFRWALRTSCDVAENPRKVSTLKMLLVERPQRFCLTYGLNLVRNLVFFLGSKNGATFGSKVALPPINPTPKSVPFFGTEFGAVFRPAYYIII